MVTTFVGMAWLYSSKRIRMMVLEVLVRVERISAITFRVQIGRGLTNNQKEIEGLQGLVPVQCRYASV